MEALAGEGEWVRRFQAGDSAAFGVIMNHYEPYVLSMLTRLAGDRTKAEDLCQETFIKALKGLASFRRDSSLKTWLFRIAHNTFTDHLRAEGPATESIEARADAGIQSAETAKDPQARMEESQVREAVETAMQILPQQQREVMHLFYWGELSVGEIAQAMRLPEGTVKTLLFRGRQALRGHVTGLLSEVVP